jgi:hypothetical protein
MDPVLPESGPDVEVVVVGTIVVLPGAVVVEGPEVPGAVVAELELVPSSPVVPVVPVDPPLEPASSAPSTVGPHPTASTSTALEHHVFKPSMTIIPTLLRSRAARAS